MKNSFVPQVTSTHIHIPMCCVYDIMIYKYMHMKVLLVISGVLIMHETFHFIYANTFWLMEVNLNTTTFMHLFQVDREINVLVLK